MAESAVISFPHDIFGDGIYAFVTLKANAHDQELNEATLIDELKALVKAKLVAYAVPHRFLVTKNLPKTRSGKIMRRLLRKIACDQSDELGDITTLAEPHVVDEIIELHNLKYNNKKKS